jgi:hypothetical protein
MLGLPSASAVDRRIPKEKFYSHAELTPKQRKVIQQQVEAVWWRHKLAESTCNLPPGESVREIQVFEIELRQPDYDPTLLPALQKAIPYPILFALTFGESLTYAMRYGGKVYTAETPPSLLGRDLEEARDNFLRQLAGLPRDGAPLAAQLEAAEHRERLNRQIAALEKKAYAERQPRRKLALAEELKHLKQQLEDLSHG